ncbi:MAG: glycosyltransferase family protein [Saprospiraceae bacterium]|nr:glycosyltransferase family protein [Saprospiraceae bacterium]
MKILYAVQATGNGHLSRAIQVTPYLQKFGQVDIFLSGNNSTLPVDLPVAFRSRGISLFNDSRGGLDFIKILKKNNWIKALTEARQLPVEKYDLIINDFEPICSRACRLKNKTSVQLSHQASFQSSLTPRPDHINRLGEAIFSYYASSSSYIGLHFQHYDHFILSPVIKKSMMEASPADLGHITVYLFGFDRAYFEYQFHRLPHLHFHCFIAGISAIEKSKNIIFFPIDTNEFTQSLLTCHGIITGAGFETPAEALYLGKRLFCIPCKNHYEQYCNAAALKRLGIPILPPGERNQLSEKINGWLNLDFSRTNLVPNNLTETIYSLVNTYSNSGKWEEPPQIQDPFWPMLQPL